LPGIRARNRPTVVTLNASLLELPSPEGELYWRACDFPVRSAKKASALAEPFEEIWHLRKAGERASGWLLAGMQQPRLTGSAGPRGPKTP